jgi:hypothetical protein
MIYGGFSGYQEVCLELFGKKLIDRYGECDCTIADAVETDDDGQFFCDCDTCEDWRSS